MTLRMMTAVPHADPLPVPAPPGLIWFLLLLTFLLHLIPMNYILGGSILAVVSRVRGKASPEHRWLASFLGKSMPTAVAATITLGVAPLLLTQVLYGRLFFSSSILMAWYWAAVIPLLIVGYFGTYRVAFKPGNPAVLAGWLAMAAFLAIAFIYTNNFTLMLLGGDLPARYAADPSGRQMNLADPTLFPRFLHMLAGALAVAGLIVALTGLIRRERDGDAARWAMRYGASWFAACSAVNVLLGGWWLMALPRDTMLRFMGGDTVATLSLGIGVLAGLGAMILVLLASRSESPAGLLRSGTALLLLTLVAMILSRDQVRQGALAGVLQPNTWVETQWVPLALFLVLLVAAAWAVVWMVLRLRQAA